jgi:hypothetical protein
LELLEVAGFVIGLAVFPAAEEDADPFEDAGGKKGIRRNATKIVRKSWL